MRMNVLSEQDFERMLCSSEVDCHWMPHDKSGETTGCHGLW